MRRMVVGLSAIVAVVLTLLSWICVALWGDGTLVDLFSRDALAGRVAIGASIGVTAGLVALAVVWFVPGFASFRRLAREGFEGLEPRLLDMAIISIAAGWSEELFFRGVVQPVTGVLLAALAFVVAHGIIPLRSRGKWAMALVLFAAGVGLGYLCRWRGLEASMAAHAGYDMAVLAGLRVLVAQQGVTVRGAPGGAQGGTSE